MHDGFARKRVSPPWIIGLLLLHFALLLIANLAVFPSGVLQPARQATGGWVNETWLVNLFLLCLEAVICLRWLAGVPFGDIGLGRKKLAPALAGTFLFWLALNGLSAAIGLVSGNGVTWNRDLFSRPGVELGALIGQLLGNALLEEVVFRGFLFVQVVLLLERVAGRKRRFALAIAASQGVFALFHLPNRLYQGYAGWEYAADFLGLLLLGACFALIFLWTDNLLLAAGVHALLNAPTLLVDAGHAGVTGLAGLVLLMISLAFMRWRKTAQTRRERRGAPVVHRRRNGNRRMGDERLDGAGPPGRLADERRRDGSASGGRRPRHP